MKKLFFVMLFCIALVMLSACGGEVEAPTDAPDDIVTGSPTEAPTEAPYDAPTEAPYDAPTDAPTEAPTDAPTDAPTEMPTDAPTEAPYDAPTETPTEMPTETPTETPTEMPTVEPTETPTETPTVEPTEIWWDNSDVQDTYYTVELVQTVYTTDDVGVKYRVRAKNPGYIGFSDNWKLYKFVDGEKIYVGSNPLESALELSPKTEGGYVDQEMPFLFRNIYTSGMQQLDTLEVGRYCLEMHRGNYENGDPIVIARLNFEVVEAE